jgi:hypothetical protein
MIPILDSYRDGAWAFERQEIDPKTKDADYHTKNAKAIYSLFCQNKTSWGISTYSKFDELRMYSRGEQSVDRYKTFLLNDTSDNTSSTVAVDSFDSLPLTRVAKKEGWYNMLWQNISPAPGILNALHGQFDKLDFDLYVDCIDPDSRALEEAQAFKKLVEGQNIEWQNKIKKDMGIPIDESAVLPKSIEELDMMRAMGSFKLNVSRAMQKLLRHSFKVSRWDNVIRKKVIDDLITIGYGAGRDYFDTEDNKFKTKWIDPAKLIIQFSNEHDYTDSEYAGYFTNWTISNLKHKLPEVPEDEWKSLAHGSRGSYGNPSSDWDTKYSLLDPATQIYGYDGFKVPVFEAEWMDTDVSKRLYYKSKYGRKSIINLGYDSQVRELTEAQKKAGATQEKKNLSVRLVRQCSWVVGKDYCFDWGVVKMASRANYSKPQLTFHVEQLLQPSIIERLVPILDQIMITFLRYQNSLAKMVENGYAINTSMLGNVTLGGDKLKPAQVIKLFKQTGMFLYQYSAGTGLYTGGAATPITAIDGGMKNRVAETIQTLEMWMKEIQNMTGINPITMSGVPSPDDTTDKIKVAAMTTQSVIRPILDATFEIKESIGECIMRRIQNGIRNSDTIRKAYAGVISPTDMEAMKKKEGDNVQYGLSLKAKPDDKMKAVFREHLGLALQNTRENRPGIDVNDSIHFLNQLDAGADIQDLEDQLRYIIEKNKQEAQANADRAIQSQAQANMQAKQMETQGRLAEINAEAKAKTGEEIIRGQVKDKLLTKEKNYELLEGLRLAADEEDGLLNTGVKK